jgi:C-terminal processing protease CtpA/Prc
VIDLDRKPFGIIREAQPVVKMYEPKEEATEDYSKLSYSEAFKRMFDDMRRSYAFNGIEGKEPKWDDVYARLAPRVAEAEQKHDAEAFYRAMLDLDRSFNDAHVGLSGGSLSGEVWQEDYGGGYGFAARELDDRHFLVVYVMDGGPAAAAGMRVGAELSRFDDQPVAEAMSKVSPPLSFSSEHSRRYQQARYLLRAPVGTRATVTFANSGEAPKTATLTAVAERQSFSATSLYNANQSALPIDYWWLASGVGYIQINSNFDDLNLAMRIFERALKTFEEDHVPGIIVDLRYNSGGIPLGLAGFLTNKEILLGQGEKFSAKTGTFEPTGPRGKFRPFQEQYHFNSVAILVGPACSSACEEEAYGFSQVPGAIVVGQYPTGGLFASVIPDKYRLPEGLTFQLSFVRYRLPNGDLFLEGKGVEPTLRVPVDKQTVLSREDVVLKAAENAVLNRR